jgi:hypothetical protein
MSFACEQICCLFRACPECPFCVRAASVFSKPSWDLQLR